ncbi:MAG: dynamin family protein [Verrucomicrobiia bacterium]
MTMLTGQEISDKTRLLLRLEEIICEYNLVGMQPYLVACNKMLKDQHIVEVGIFGRFKSGKSSFINSLIGKTLLPISAIPLTAVITKISYGRREGSIVNFLDGRVEEIPIQDVVGYVGEAFNPKNCKNVDSVQIQTPQLCRYEPIQFIDTPGLESVFEHNTKTSIEWLPNVVVAIVAISCDAPLAEQDINLIGSLLDKTNKIIILLTKADLLQESQIAEVKEFVANMLHKKYNREFPIYFYSTKPGYEHLREMLDREVFLPLKESGRKTFEDVINFKLTSLCRATKALLEVALQSSQCAENTKSELKIKLMQERERFLRVREEIRIFENHLKAAAFDDYLRELEPEQKRIQHQLQMEFSEALTAYNLKLPAFMEEFGRWLRQRLATELLTISSKRRLLFLEPLNKSKNYLTNLCEASRSRLIVTLQQALGVELNFPEFSVEIPEIESPPIDVNIYFMVPMDIIGNLVPAWLLKPFLKSNLRRRINDETEKNISRLAAQWQARVGVAIKELCSRTINFMENEFSTIESMLMHSPDKSAAIARIIDELNEVEGDILKQQ